MIRPEKVDAKFFLVSIGLGAAILFFDLSLPLGVAGGVPYVALVLIGLWTPGQRYALSLAAIATALTVLGYLYSPSGGVPWVVLTNRVLAVFAIWITALLIAHRKQAEVEWRKLSRAVEQSPASVMVTDTEGAIEYVNPKFTAVTGYAPEEVIGKNPRILKSGHTSSEEYRELWRTITAGGEWRGELRNRTKNGEFYWESASISPIRDADGTITNFLAVKEDITERIRTEAALRESEERFRTVVNHSPAKIHIKDLEGRYLLVNKEAERLFGVTDEEARGKTAHEIFPEKRAADFTRHDRAVMQTEQTIAEEEEWSQDDGVHTFLTVKFPIRDGEDRITAVGAIGTDITERKRAEQELYIAMERANAANRAKSQFLAMMSHELRTPLNAIIGFSELIRDEMFGSGENAKYRDYASDINESGLHLLDVINDILDLAKIDARKVELDEGYVDVLETIDFCLLLVKEQAELAGVRMTTEIADGIPHLRADERKLKQILLNLLSNAVKFTPADGTITVMAWHSSDSGFVLQVIDTGIGIALEDIPKALAVFCQVESDLNRNYEGTGLGLPLSKALVELHGGSLDLQSEVCVGTTVTVRFPAERIVRFQDPSRSSSVVSSGGSGGLRRIAVTNKNSST